METQNSYLQKKAKIEDYLTQVVEHASKLDRLAKLVERANATKPGLIRTLECVSAIEKSLKRPERQIDSVEWVKKVYPVINYCGKHVPDSLELTLTLAEDLRSELLTVTGKDKELCTSLLKIVDYATQQHYRLCELILEANARCQASLTNYRF